LRSNLEEKWAIEFEVKYLWKLRYLHDIEVACSKGQPGALKLPHTQGPEGVPPFGVLYAALPYFLHKRLFPGLEPVTFQSHDNNFTSCATLY